MTFSILGTDTQTSQAVELPQTSRREGLYIIGATGTGKSTLLENLILQDINQGLGVCVLDPHGDLVNAVISRMKKRLEDVILIDLGSRDYVAGLHLFHCEHPDNAFEAENVVQAVMHILEKVYQISRDTPLMNQYFINIAKTLIYHPQATVLDIPRLLTDATFRASLLAHVPDDDVHWFWTELYEQQRRGRRSDEILSMVTDKLVEFNSRVLKPWFGQNRQTLNLRRIMDERKVLLVKLKARWQSMTSLIGSIFIAQILDAAYSREDTRVNKRKQFNVYADEFQTFASQDFAQLFTEARKYGIGITISHQVFEQLDDTIKATIKQAANIVVFRVSADNAKEIAGEFDTTPPEGPPIYEKQMRPVGKTYVVEYWELQEAEEEYNRLTEQIAALEKLLPPHIRELENKLPLVEAATPNSVATYGFSRFDVSLTISRGIGAVMTPQLWQIAENIMYWFRPYIWNTDVERYIKSLYELSASPIRSENHPYWHKTDFFKRGKWYDFYHIFSYRVDFHGNQHPCDAHMRADTMREVREMKAEGFRYFAINPNIQENTPYRFPAHLPLVFEVEDAGNTMPLPLRQELAAMYEPLRPHAQYYFDAQIYDDLLLNGLYDPPHEFKAELFLRPWKGPYFRTDADWLYILKWIANKYLDIYSQQTTLQRMKERQEELVRTCLIKETRIEWLGWHEPVPVTEWAELAKIKAFVRDFGEEFLVGDNVKYSKRPGPPLYGSDEVERRLANQIKLLPKFTARMRIASGEYTITTEKPSSYSNEQELHRRIQAIHEQNTKDGYLRLRSEVETELAQRHRGFQFAPSVTPQKLQQPYSRKVPVQGQCSKCGFSKNTPGAKFCNQCGEKL